MTPATLDQASKEDLRDELLRIKQREKKLKDENKAKGEKMIGTAVTIIAAGGLGMLLGGRVHDAKAADGFADKSEEDQEKAIADATSVASIPIDLLVGLGGIALGLSDAAGDFSSFLLAAGTGGVSSFATRELYHRAETKKAETVTP